MKFLWLSHFKDELYLSNNELTGTLPTEIGYLIELGKLLCTHCLNSLLDLYSANLFVNLRYEYNIWSWRVLTDLSLTSCNFCDSHFKEELDLSSNELTGTLTTKMGNMNLGKLLFIHCLNSLMNFSFCMIIRIALLWTYDLKRESFNWLISHHAQFLQLSYFIGSLNLEGNKLLLSGDWLGYLNEPRQGEG